MSLCDSTCKPCIYSGVMSTWGIACNYILITGNRRGCPAGKGCERRIVGKKPAQSIESQIFIGKDKPKRDRNSYDRDWYQRNKDKISKQRKERRQKKREGKPVSQFKTMSFGERKQLTRQRTQAYCQGRQAAVIEEYLTAHGLTNRQMGDLIGVSATTIQKWHREHNLADWQKLAKLGIRRPEGL